MCRSSVSVFVPISLLACLCSLSVSAQVTYRSKPFPYTMWGSDSLYVGGGLAVADSGRPVVVRWKDAFDTICKGEVSFMEPGYPDSARSLFASTGRTSTNRSPLSVVLGSFPARTPLYFRYVSQDTMGYTCSQLLLDELFTGQNRAGIDSYATSGVLPSGLYGYRFALVGRIDADSVEVAFDGMQALAYRSVIFTVTNVIVTGLEKFQVSRPLAQPPADTSFSAQITVVLSVPTVGNVILVRSQDPLRIMDTTYDPIASGIRFSVFYTTDGTNPRTSASRVPYTSPLTFTSTTTLKAFATVVGDTNWWDSEVLTHIYTLGQAHAERRLSLPARSSDRIGSCVLYAIDGRLVPGESSGQRPKSGVYLARPVQPLHTQEYGRIKRLLVLK